MKTEGSCVGKINMDYNFGTFVLYRYWLSVGAQPSDPVQRLLFRAGLLPPPPMVAMGRKGGPRDTRSVDPLSGRVMMSDQPTKASVDDQENKS